MPDFSDLGSIVIQGAFVALFTELFMGGFKLHRFSYWRVGVSFFCWMSLFIGMKFTNPILESYFLSLGAGVMANAFAFLLSLVFIGGAFAVALVAVQFGYRSMNGAKASEIINGGDQ
jgi:hypothetical protein